jgi:class 3 adenylate cyclase
VFDSQNAVTSAIEWAIQVQESHQDDPILDPDDKPVEVKIGIHWGTAAKLGGNLIGSAIDLAAR